MFLFLEQTIACTVMKIKEFLSRVAFLIQYTYKVWLIRLFRENTVAMLILLSETTLRNFQLHNALLIRIINTCICDVVVHSTVLCPHRKKNITILSYLNVPSILFHKLIVTNLYKFNLCTIQPTYSFANFLLIEFFRGISPI